MLVDGWLQQAESDGLSQCCAASKTNTLAFGASVSSIQVACGVEKQAQTNQVA
eukprot:m.33817 g.33817  ORF g.33817 m.33817 type:complete len:53 (-) comp9673_c0_seq3:338-496(-)